MLARLCGRRQGDGDEFAFGVEHHALDRLAIQAHRIEGHADGVEHDLVARFLEIQLHRFGAAQGALVDVGHDGDRVVERHDVLRQVPGRGGKRKRRLCRTGRGGSGLERHAGQRDQQGGLE
jgi:hypothetical protein